MNEEHQDWLKQIETVAEEMGQLIRETAEAVVETADLMMQIPMAMAERMEEAIATEVEHLLDEMTSWFPPPSVHLSIWSSIEWQSSDLEPWLEMIEPGQAQQNACVGCRHYHGRIYDGNLLVCGMHPYGWKGDRCPDWEGK